MTISSGLVDAIDKIGKIGSRESRGYTCDHYGVSVCCCSNPFYMYLENGDSSRPFGAIPDNLMFETTSSQ